MEGDGRWLRRVHVRQSRLDRFIGQEENTRGVGQLKQRREVTIEESAGEVQGMSSGAGLEWSTLRLEKDDKFLEEEDTAG